MTKMTSACNLVPIVKHMIPKAFHQDSPHGEEWEEIVMSWLGIGACKACTVWFVLNLFDAVVASATLAAVVLIWLNPDAHSFET